MLRDIIHIDEELCDGCGLCIPSCAEGALAIVNGKAKVVSDHLCDGLGACLGHCPKGALTVVRKDTDPFDEQAVHQRLEKLQTRQPDSPSCQSADMVRAQSGPLPTWPVQLRLVPPTAPFLAGTDILLASDCSVAALPDFHAHLNGRVLLMACPKFDDAADMGRRLADILRIARPKSVEILRMEVPCCRGLAEICRQAAAGLDISTQTTIVSTTGLCTQARNANPPEVLG
jgi:ferredoxin